MPEKIQLFIADPCHERWDDMQPRTEGRYCGSCQKTVVDFSMMSDLEVLSWFSGTGRSVCGRFSDDQLKRELMPVTAPKRRRWTLWWQFLLTGWLLSSEASAQMGKVASQRIEHVDARRLSPAADELWIRVMDTENDEPISRASVQWGKGKAFRMTDDQGWVSFTRKELRRARNITISAVGYTMTTFNLSDTGKDEYVRVLRLPRAGDLPTDTVISYGVTMCRRTMGLVASVMVTRTSLWKDTLALLGLVKQPFTVYPNPTSRGSVVTLSLRQPLPGNYMVQLFSSGGALVESMRIEGVNGSRTELLTIPETVAAGHYFMRLQHEQTGKVYTEKVEVL